MKHKYQIGDMVLIDQPRTPSIKARIIGFLKRDIGWGPMYFLENETLSRDAGGYGETRLTLVFDGNDVLKGML